jgi:hypothetical protein
MRNIVASHQLATLALTQLDKLLVSHDELMRKLARKAATPAPAATKGKTP